MSSYTILPIVYVIIDEEFFPIDGNVVTVIDLFQFTGTITNSILKGYLMQSYGPIQFVVIILYETIILFVGIFLFIWMKYLIQEKSLRVNNS